MDKDVEAHVDAALNDIEQRWPEIAILIGQMATTLIYIGDYSHPGANEAQEFLHKAARRLVPKEQRLTRIFNKVL